MSDAQNTLLNKYRDMAKIRDDYNTINNNNFLLPTMGEMVQEDLMNEILEQYISSDGTIDENATYLDAAYYTEQPFSTQLGYHPEEAAFVLKARYLADANNNRTWNLNKYDGDTTAYLLNDISDGNMPFTFNDGKTYKSFKDYYKKMNGSKKLTLRHVGMDAPEIPHLEIQPVLKTQEKTKIVTMTYEKLKSLILKNKNVCYLKHPVNDNKTEVKVRKDDEEVKLLKIISEGKEYYKEILRKATDEEVPEANGLYNYYVTVNVDDSESNTILDGYKAQEIIKEKLLSASEILLVVDANQLSVSKNTSTNKSFNSLYYLPDAIDYLLEEWSKTYNDIPATNYTYNPYGSDAYGRSLGAVYIKTEEQGQMKWINLNKYVIAQTEFTESNPDYNSSPELQEMKNGMSEVFKLWSYDKSKLDWLDSFNKLSGKSYQDKLELHKRLTGIDFTQTRDCSLMIGDTLMLVPPESIRNITQVNYERIPNIRSKGTMAKQMGQNEHMLEISLYFYDDIGINGIKHTVESPNGTKMTYYMNGLRSLIAQFKIAPYLPIENGYINDVLGIEAVSLMNLHIETVKGFPRLLKVILSLREFNYRTFMPDIPVDDTTGELEEGKLAMLNPMFAKCFNWEVFRYYYQRAIIAGQKLANDFEFATYDYNLQYYSHKNSIGPWYFCPPQGLGGKVSFYVPDENWLEQALALKKERDANYMSDFASVELSDNAKEFLNLLSNLNNKIARCTGNTSLSFHKQVSQMIGQHNVDNRKLLAKIPDFAFTLNPNKQSGVYTRSISDANYSALYFRDKGFNKKVDKEVFRETYVKQIRNAFLDEINNPSYMTGLALNEIITYNKASTGFAAGSYTIGWEFAIKLNTSIITDDDMIAIREVLSKAADVKMEDVFEDNIIRVRFNMLFVPVVVGVDGEVKLKSVSNLIGGEDAMLIAGATAENGATTNTFMPVDTADTKALDAIYTVLNQDNTSESDEPINSQAEAIDFYIKDYKNPANMPFVPYVRDVRTEGVGATLANSFTDISLKAVEGVGPQYLGGQDTVLELSLITDDLVVVSALNNLPTLASAMAKRYKRILPTWPIKIQSDMTNLLGVSEVLIDAIEVSTVEGYPGVYSIVMRLTSVDRTQRQREALRRLDITPNGGKVDYNGHSNLAMKNFFAIEEQLAKAELYPDLDLPTLDELGKLGYRFVKYSGTNRYYPDPDFYITYNYPYTSLIIKKLVKDSLSQQLLNTENGVETLQEFSLKDTLGLETVAKIEAYTGISEKEGKKGKAKEYEDIMLKHRERVKEIATKKGVSKQTQKDWEDKYELNSLLRYITMCDVNDGWEFKPGWRAPLCDDSTNESIRRLGVSDPTNDGKKYNNYYAKEIKKYRKEALRLIDDILQKPMLTINQEASDNIIGVTPNTVIDVVNTLFYDNESGKKLIQKLCPGIEIEKANALTMDNIFQSSYFNKPNPLNYIAGYAYASGCALSGNEEYKSNITIDKWRPNHHSLSVDYSNIVYAQDNTKIIMPYAVEDRIEGLSKLSTRIDSAIDNGTCFGAYRITSYSSSSIVSDIGERSDKSIMYGGNYFDQTYKDRNNLDKDNKRKINAGFIDPYYNYAGEKSQTVKDFKKSILLSKKCNIEAFLREMLVHMRRLILDGYLISEIDFIANNFDEVYGQLNITETTNMVLTPQQAMGGGQASQILNDTGHMFEQLGFSVEEMQQLLNSIKEANERSFCARLIYPFLGAITRNASDISNILRDRDYNSLNSLTGYIEAGEQVTDSRSKVIKFLSALSGINLTLAKEGKNESSVSPSQMLMNNMMKDVYIAAASDPRAYLLHSFYDMLVNDKRGRLVRAFPTYYVVFVDEGRKLGSWKLHDNFYNMNSIGEIQVVKSRKIAADTCTITMNNMFNSYTTEPDITTTQQYTDIYGLRDVYDSIFSPQIYFDKEKRIRLRQQVPDKVVLQPGIRIHVRMGYSADGSKLPIVFNGKVAEVEVGDVAQIVAQGDGHELMNPLNAFGEMEVTSLDQAQSVFTWFKDIRGSLTGGGETPRNLLAKLLTAKHGGWKKAANIMFDGRWFNDNPFGITHFGDQQFSNIFELGEPVQNLYEVSDNTLLTGYNELYSADTASKISPIINTSLQDKTFWDLLHLAANTGIDYIGAVRDFGFRSTIFLGKPNHYYAYAYELLDGKVVEKRKPFQQFHYYDSYNDIIYNSIKASEAQMKTNAVGLWQSSSAWWGREQSTVGPIYLDMNIYPEYQKSMTVDTGLLAAGNGGIDIPLVDYFTERWNMDANDNKVNKSTAWRVTANALKNSVKDMYQGDLGVIGDPSVKPYDRCYIYDTYEDMMGMFEVEAVIHTMSVETGFTTSIMPDVIARHGDSYEAANHSLLSSVASTLIVTATANTANLLWSANVNNKLVTSIAKSKALYGASSRLNKLAGDFVNTPGMQKLLSENPTVSQLFETLNFNPKQTELDLHYISKLIDNLNEIKFTGNLSDDMSSLIKAMSLYGDLDIESYKKAMKAAQNADKYGVHKGVNGIDLDNIFKEMDNAKDAVDAAFEFSKLSTEINLKQFSSAITGNAELMNKIELDKKICKILVDEWGQLDNIPINQSTIKQLSEILSNKHIQTAIKEEKLVLKGMDSLYDSFKTVLKSDGVFKNFAKALKGGDALDNLLKIVTGVLKFNWASILADVAIGTIVHIMTKNTQELFTRWLQGIQAVDVYPLKKNAKPLIAGMNGHKGSVAMYPVNDGYDSIQGMILQFVEGFKNLDGNLPITDFILGEFVNEGVLNKLSVEWRRDLGLENPNDEGALDETSEDLKQNIYNSISTSYAATANHAYAIMTRYRILNFDTKGKTDPTYKYYEIKGITASNIATNEKVKSLYYVGKDDDIWKAIIDKRFVIAHNDNYTNLISIPFEDGSEKVPVIINNGVIDTPLVQEDVMYILKYLVNSDKLKKGTIHFKSGARLNDTATWKNTGFAIILEYKGSDSKMQEVLDDLLSDTTIKDGHKLFAYKKSGSKFMITVYAPKQDDISN